MTPMLNALRADKDALKAAGRTHGAENIPLRRFAEPTELAKTICFALSDDASYTTGNTFIVDGGLSL
jgi:NAD(P)-dependent dehydrogenase (short-subunit alcohol dehydrogenase family)